MQKVSDFFSFSCTSSDLSYSFEQYKNSQRQTLKAIWSYFKEMCSFLSKMYGNSGTLEKAETSSSVSE